jgi:GNAT superfamily N-acetyltransferase
MPEMTSPMLEQVEALTEDQVGQLHALYQGEWWSAGRALDDVRRMLTHSGLVVGLVEPGSGTLVGFGRVLTGFVYHATLYDVIVVADYWGQRIGHRLIEAVVHHPRLSGVATIWLCCLPEMVPFYERFGFTGEIGELKWMRRSTLA